MSKLQKSILIETVANGFLVRPFSPCEHWATSELPSIYVFRTTRELAEQLPALLRDDAQGPPGPEAIPPECLLRNEPIGCSS